MMSRRSSRSIAQNALDGSSATISHCPRTRKGQRDPRTLRFARDAVRPNRERKGRPMAFLYKLELESGGN
jgi:hypothetical protein